jgi:hypothetical protein
MMPPEALFAAYEAASGLKVDPRRLDYYAIFNRYHAAVLTLAAAARTARCAATHQDVLLNHVSGLGYWALSDLADYFGRVTA